MKLTLKRRFQNLANQIQFPIFFYIYESGKLIGANEGAKYLIGWETKNINQIWQSGKKKKLSDKVLMNGCIFLEREKVMVNGYCLEVDMEFCSFQLDQEHIITVLLEQSYKHAFEKMQSIHVPGIMWKDKRLYIRGQNSVSLQMTESGKKIEPGYLAENSYDREVINKVFAFEERVLAEQLESYGVLQQIQQEHPKRGFAEVNRIALMGRDGKSVGILVIYELLKEQEEIRGLVSRLQRKNIALEGCLKQSRRIAYSIKEDKKGTVDYLSEQIEAFGYQQEEFYSGKIGWLDLVCEEDRKWLEKQGQTLEVRRYQIYNRERKKIYVYDKPTGYGVYQGDVYRFGVIWQEERNESVWS